MGGSASSPSREGTGSGPGPGHGHSGPGQHHSKRLTSLNQVTTVQTPDSSPISPSIGPLAMSGHGTSAFSGKNHARGSNVRTNSMSTVSSPTLFYGHSSSVSSLGFNARPRLPDSDMSSTSSSEDEFAYDSDERMSIPPSRRTSMSSGSMLPLSLSRRPSMHDEPLAGLGLGSLSFRSKIERSTAAESATASGSGASSTITNDSGHGRERTQIRQIGSSSKALKPKAKSLLRISRDLQEELSPFDYEVQRESEITTALRGDQDDRRVEKLQHTDRLDGKMDDQDMTPTNDNNDNSNDHGREERKRKATIDDLYDNGWKRRAVSPAVSPAQSPASSGNIGTKRSNFKQVFDTSDGLQNMSL